MEDTPFFLFWVIVPSFPEDFHTKYINITGQAKACLTGVSYAI
jgi:hypothetical protein